MNCGGLPINTTLPIPYPWNIAVKAAVIEAGLLALLTIADWGPCGPSNPLAIIGYIAHLPLLVLLSPIFKALELPGAIALALLFLGQWALIFGVTVVVPVLIRDAKNEQRREP